MHLLPRDKLEMHEYCKNCRFLKRVVSSYDIPTKVLTVTCESYKKCDEILQNALKEGIIGYLEEGKETVEDIDTREAFDKVIASYKNE